MLSTLKDLFKLLISHELALKLFVVGGAIANLIIMAGIGLWSILGAWKMVVYILSM